MDTGDGLGNTAGNGKTVGDGLGSGGEPVAPDNGASTGLVEFVGEEDTGRTVVVGVENGGTA